MSRELDDILIDRLYGKVINRNEVYNHLELLNLSKKRLAFDLRSLRIYGNLNEKEFLDYVDHFCDMLYILVSRDFRRCKDDHDRVG